MKKAILMPIQPQWLKKILNGEKTIEIRKTMPKCELPIDIYLYCTYGDLLVFDYGDLLPSFDLYMGVKVNKKRGYGNQINGLVVAKFTLNEIDKIEALVYENKIDYACFYDDILLKNSCLDYSQLRDYLGEKDGYALFINDLQTFDKPMELSEFYKNDYEVIRDKLESNGCDSNNCLYAIDNSILGDDGYCNFDLCPKLRIARAPQSWQYVYVEEVKNDKK